MDAGAGESVREKCLGDNHTKGKPFRELALSGRFMKGERNYQMSSFNLSKSQQTSQSGYPSAQQYFPLFDSIHFR